MLSSRFEAALGYATRLHATQQRKGTTIPMVAHLLAVAALALEHGADEDEAIAALLHDAAEDQGGAATLAQIRSRFGVRIADIVEGCSDTLVLPKPPWQERKESYLRHLRLASQSVLLVSACDKLHNARAILSDYRAVGESLWSRFNGGRRGTLWYYRAVLGAYVDAGFQSPLVEELERVVAELERLAGVQRAA